MTKEDIIRMAGEAGITVSEGRSHEKLFRILKRYADLVASAEREACAKVCDEFLPLGNKCAYAIRARGQA